MITESPSGGDEAVESPPAVGAVAVAGRRTCSPVSIEEREWSIVSLSLSRNFTTLFLFCSFSLRSLSVSQIASFYSETCLCFASVAYTLPKIINGFFLLLEYFLPRLFFSKLNSFNFLYFFTILHKDNLIKFEELLKLDLNLFF